MVRASNGDTPLEQLRRLYFNASAATVQRDLRRAIELFKQLASDEARERAAVYMDGLSQMRSEWSGSGKNSESRQVRGKR